MTDASQYSKQYRKLQINTMTHWGMWICVSSTNCKQIVYIHVLWQPVQVVGGHCKRQSCATKGLLTQLEVFQCGKWRAEFLWFSDATIYYISGKARDRQRCVGLGLEFHVAHNVSTWREWENLALSGSRVQKSLMLEIQKRPSWRWSLFHVTECNIVRLWRGNYRVLHTLSSIP